ncbi:protoheme IX farnesyltransferase [Blastococcus aggregatus]|uniref:Protoheme IX farnesyltransferase n=1 Tax=Blastococcus aggregatus TaxID=38502 RepID=A0A285VA24_9ACTN|nr:heme o synthase [Blastococcus aggregatus]SOC49896.1 protoheme IX farnesyltransferase [Blastococcus aggregatus]
MTALSERSAAASRRESTRSSTGRTAVVRRRVLAFVGLTKPRIIELLLVTTVPAMMLADRGWPSLSLLLFTLLGGTLAAGAANVFNCYFDRDIDKLMQRTQKRPLVTGEVTPRAALIFGIVLTVTSIALLLATTTVLAAALAAGAIFYYAVLYTMVFKRHTRRSTEWGGVPGAAPVLIGWAAVTGSLDWPAVVVFGIVFAWQMPHFWALALRFKDDYARADVPMLPVVTSELSVGRQSVAWAYVTVAVSLLLWPVATDYGIGLGYTVPAVLLGAWFVLESHRLLGRIKRGGDIKSMSLFHVSISYLSLLMVAIIVDAIV